MQKQIVNRQKIGFTLIELLVVIAIIAILAAISASSTWQRSATPRIMTTTFRSASI